MINGPQLRSARAWLNLSQDQVAEITGVAKRTIARIEAEATVPHERTLRDIQAALEALGVEFIVEGGVGTGIRIVKNPDR
ncbi:helix-turn-helix transcriptional regulator [Bosea sp. CRIB-10]|uniref:helix-turn-helix transcriptional regulator n=1 Tax=Bosea sp. CRIB-10 TaxID=378404 RepID=UPI000B804D82|nr:helix-turn-helix transcriptional regulator [Bosea sp. CRIB-10]